jgi:hypothetical protein
MGEIIYGGSRAMQFAAVVRTALLLGFHLLRGAIESSMIGFKPARRSGWNCNTVR